MRFSALTGILRPLGCPADALRLGALRPPLVAHAAITQQRCLNASSAEPAPPNDLHDGAERLKPVQGFEYLATTRRSGRSVADFRGQ